jgi:hypothetical protein
MYLEKVKALFGSRAGRRKTCAVFCVFFAAWPSLALMRSLLDTRVFHAVVCAFLGHHHRRRLLLTAYLAAPVGRLTDRASNTKTSSIKVLCLRRPWASRTETNSHWPSPATTVTAAAAVSLSCGILSSPRPLNPSFYFKFLLPSVSESFMVMPINIFIWMELNSHKINSFFPSVIDRHLYASIWKFHGDEWGVLLQC